MRLRLATERKNDTEMFSRVIVRTCPVVGYAQLHEIASSSLSGKDKIH